MTHIITYSLRLDTPNSDEYYRIISAFADAWLVRTKPEVCDLVTGFHEYRQGCGELDRSDEEYTFELLTLGVLVREHGLEASCLPGWSVKILNWLTAVRERWPRTEGLVKLLRGWADGTVRRTNGTGKSDDVVGDIIVWLKVNNEDAKVERFTQWHDYFLHNNGHETIARCLALADNFAKASHKTLGKYTERVEHFLTEVAPKYCWRYDARFVSQTQLEYHLGMLGTEILNQAYRQRFLSTCRKVVIVPPCMRAPAKKCKAIETSFGTKCQACTSSCRVNQITKLGGKRGFDVYMIPDDMQVFGAGREAENIGLVGISCVLTNWNGGWDTGALGIPAQGLLLDYVGCKFHWDKDGFPTDTNLKKLQAVLGLAEK